MGFRIAWGKGDYAGAAAFADSVSRLSQLSFQALGRFQRAGLATLAGRLSEAGRLGQEAEEINLRRGTPTARYGRAMNSANLQLLLLDRPEAALHVLDSVLARYPLDSLPAASRPYLGLAVAYARAGAVPRAEALSREYERAVPEVLKRNDPERSVTQGMIAMASGKPADAIASFRAYRENQGCQTCYLYEIGQAFDALRQPDSALASFEALATLPEPGPAGRPLVLPPTYHRLGELYESKGDTKRALEYYGKFVDLWKDADPELQPRVADVRKRIAELSAKER